MDYKKKYEKANNVLKEIQKAIDNREMDGVDFCEQVCYLLKEYNK